MIKCLEEIIIEAKCCATSYAAKFVDSKTFGREDDSDYMMLMMYIDVLERNKTTHHFVKNKVAIVPKKIDFSSLKKTNNTLHLNIQEAVVCEDVEVEPCLPDSDISKIVEYIKKRCSTCNCNCN